MVSLQFRTKLSFITLFLVPKLSFIEHSNGIWMKSFRIGAKVALFSS